MLKAGAGKIVETKMVMQSFWEYSKIPTPRSRASPPKHMTTQHLITLTTAALFHHSVPQAV